MPVLLPVPQVLLEFQLQAVQALPGSQEYPGLDFWVFGIWILRVRIIRIRVIVDSGYPGSDYLDLDYPGSDYPGLDFQDSPDLDSLGSRDLWCL